MTVPAGRPEGDTGRGPDRRPPSRLDLTPGQRWTAVIAVGLAVALLLVGAPTKHVIRVAQAAQPPVTEVPTVTPAPATSPQSLTPSAPIPASPPPAAGPGPVPRPTPAPIPDSPLPAAAPRVVLAAWTGDDPLPGRDDVAIATAMLAGSGVRASVVGVQGSQADCAAVLRAGHLVVASVDPTPALATCLRRHHAVLVAFDERPLAAPSISTRRQVAAAVADAAPILHGQVGVVADARFSRDIARGVALLKRNGVDVVTTQVVVSGTSAGVDINNGVRAFATAGVTTELFAVPVDVQNLWAAQEQVLLPGVTHVVADVDDSIVDEDYAPAFEGATAVTSQRGGWFARAHGATRLERSCLARFARTDTDPVPLDGVERARVLTWCGELALVRRALAAVGPGTSITHALRQPLTSPVTSQLRVTAGRFGPSRLATVEWHLSCRCWEQQTGFRAVAA